MDNLPETKIIRSYRQSLSMKMLPDATLVVKAPILLPKFMIDRFIREHADWVEKQIQKLNQKPIQKQFVDGEEFLYLGQKITLKIGDYKSFGLDGNNLLLPKFMSFRAKKEITQWFIKQAEIVIKNQLQKYAKEMNTEYNSVWFSDTQSKWGTCTHDNRLQFNWRLVMAPILVINYVVVHELSHTIHKNHSRSFWSKVRLYNPSYRQQIKWLKVNGDKLKL